MANVIRITSIIETSYDDILNLIKANSIKFVYNDTSYYITLPNYSLIQKQITHKLVLHTSEFEAEVTCNKERLLNMFIRTRLPTLSDLGIDDDIFYLNVKLLKKIPDFIDKSLLLYLEDEQDIIGVIICAMYEILNKLY